MRPTSSKSLAASFCWMSRDRVRRSSASAEMLRYDDHDAKRKRSRGSDSRKGRTSRRWSDRTNYGCNRCGRSDRTTSGEPRSIQPSRRLARAAIKLIKLFFYYFFFFYVRRLDKELQILLLLLILVLIFANDRIFIFMTKFFILNSSSNINCVLSLLFYILGYVLSKHYSSLINNIRTRDYHKLQRCLFYHVFANFTVYRTTLEPISNLN